MENDPLDIRYNPYILQNLNPDLKGITPIEYFGRYNFPNAKSASEFIQTPKFTNFWDRNNVGLKNIGIRSEMNDSGRYASPLVNRTYADEKARIEANRLRRIGISETQRQQGFSPTPIEFIQKAADRAGVSARAEGRFYTQQGLPNSAVNTEFYMRPTLQEASYPIRVIADERLSKFSLSDRLPYNGLITDGNLTHSEKMQARNNFNLTRVVGKDLGASLSSNPSTEAFVSSQMANPTYMGGESRVAGRVNPNGSVELIGEPKVPVAMQIAKNAAGMAGNAVKLGLAGAGLAGYTASFLQDAPKTIVEYGVPFTPLKFGLGPVISLNAGEDEMLDEGRTHRRELQRAALIDQQVNSFADIYNKKTSQYEEGY